MLVAIAILALFSRAHAVPQASGVTSAIAPAQSALPGCYPNYDGEFQVGPVDVSPSKRDLDKRDNNTLAITLHNGTLTDTLGRTGYIASNYQFQFDAPPQAGALWTAGFSVCENGRLTLGNDQIWYKCLSGEFYNIYIQKVNTNCNISYFIAQGLNGAGGPISAPVSTASSTISSTTQQTSGTTATGMSPSTTSGGSKANSGLSSGAKIGIGVGVGLGGSCLLLALASFIFLRRRSHQRDPDGPSSVSELDSDKPIGELSTKRKTHELVAGRGQLPELPVKEEPQELSTQRD